MLAGAIRAWIDTDVRNRRRNGQAGVRELVVDRHVEHERKAWLRVYRRAHLDATPVACTDIPWTPAKEAVDGVVLLGLRQRCLVALPVELKAAVGQPVGPRHQNSAMATVGHPIDGERMHHITIATTVCAQRSADFHHDCDLIFVTQFELLARGSDLWRRRHSAMIPESARVLNARSKLLYLRWRDAPRRGSDQSGARTRRVCGQRQRER